MADQKAQCDSNHDDKELDALLDDALQDFDGPVNSNLAAASSKKDDQSWTEDFLVQATQELENTMKQLGIASSDEDCSKMASCVKDAIKSFQGNSINFDENSLNDMLQNLDEGCDPQTENDVKEHLETLNKSLSETLPFMNQVLKTLLAKELMHAPLKEITETYSSWLDQNKSTLNKDVYEKYRSQLSYMFEVKQLYDEENEEDPESMKQERYIKIMDIMVKIQELGHPPDIIAGKLPDMNLDFENLVSGSNLIDSCTII